MRRKPENMLVDSGSQADKVWLLSVQAKLYQWSQAHPDEQYRELWNWITDPRNLRCAWRRVAANRGHRTSGIDGMTVSKIRRKFGVDEFLQEIRETLRNGSYRPQPCRRKLIPKPGKPGAFRPLGIPTVKDRVVQSAIKQILEPIFEAGFWHVSYGFRPGRSCHGALEHIRMSIRPRAKAEDGKRHTMPYQRAIEGDVEACFDKIDHHLLMQRVRSRVADKKVTRLLTRFLKAGVLSEDQILRTDSGTPQGGIASPLLANIALSVIEERYERWTRRSMVPNARSKTDGVTAARNTRMADRLRGRPVFFPIRYADDFVVLVSGTGEDAEAEKSALADYLALSMGLTLSPAKTKITPLEEGFEFLGHRVRLRWHPTFGWTPRIEIPKAKIIELRRRIKRLTARGTTSGSLVDKLRELNPILRGWAYFYQFCTNAKPIFATLDWYVRDRLWRWMRRKYPKANATAIARHLCPGATPRRIWTAGNQTQFLMSSVPVMRFRRGWMRGPDYAGSLGEPDA